MSLLEMHGLHRTYTRGPEIVEALRGVDLAVEPATIVAVAGASGSGKTTLLNIAAGIDRPTAGRLWVEGAELTAAVSVSEDHASAMLRNKPGRKDAAILPNGIRPPGGCLVVRNIPPMPS